MDILLGITGKDFVLLGTDTSCARSIVRMKADQTKARALSPHTVLVVSGESGDTVNFADFIQRNIRLYAIRNGLELEPQAAAAFTRREMADSLRTREAYQVNLLLGGFNPKTNEPSLYWIDYLAAMVKIPYACHGYASYFCLSTMDRYYHPDMTLAEAKELMKKCMLELKTRFIVNFPNFEFHVIDKEGNRIVTL